jgi:hypothetical protein
VKEPHRQPDRPRLSWVERVEQQVAPFSES